MRSPNICSSDSLNMIPSSSIQAVVKCKVFSLLTAESGSFCISGSISWLTPSSVLQYLVVTRLLQGELWLNIDMQFVFAAGCFCVLGRDANKKNHRVIQQFYFCFSIASEWGFHSHHIPSSTGCFRISWDGSVFSGVRCLDSCFPITCGYEHFACACGPSSVRLWRMSDQRFSPLLGETCSSLLSSTSSFSLCKLVLRYFFSLS